jgi:hypothetical protein
LVDILEMLGPSLYRTQCVFGRIAKSSDDALFHFPNESARLKRTSPSVPTMVTRLSSNRGQLGGTTPDRTVHAPSWPACSTKGAHGLVELTVWVREPRMDRPQLAGEIATRPVQLREDLRITELAEVRVTPRMRCDLHPVCGHIAHGIPRQHLASVELTRLVPPSPVPEESGREEDRGREPTPAQQWIRHLEVVEISVVEGDDDRMPGRQPMLATVSQELGKADDVVPAPAQIPQLSGESPAGYAIQRRALTRPSNGVIRKDDGRTRKPVEVFPSFAGVAHPAP